MKQKAFNLYPSTLFVYKREKAKTQKSETDTTTTITTLTGTTAIFFQK